MLVNFIKLERGKPTRVHFTDSYRVDRDIADTELGGTKLVHSLVFQVDRLEGAPVFATMSFLSAKAMATFQPFLPGKRFLDYEFLITQEGFGFNTEYRVQPILITAERALELATSLPAGEAPVNPGGG